MWHEGTIGLDGPFSSVVLAHFWAHTDDQSKSGIDGGKIDKLRIKIKGQIAAEYDQKWIIKPDCQNKVAIMALSIVLDNYN